MHRRKGFTHSFSATASFSNALLSLGLTKVQQIDQVSSVRNSEVDHGQTWKRGWKGNLPRLGLLDPLLDRLGARHLSPSSTRDLAQREEQSLDPNNDVGQWMKGDGEKGRGKGKGGRTKSAPVGSGPPAIQPEVDFLNAPSICVKRIAMHHVSSRTEEDQTNFKELG